MKSRILGAVLFALTFAVYSSLTQAANPLETFPTLIATLNGDSQTNLFPGFGIVEDNGAVIETNRMTMAESQNSFSAFGVTRNSLVNIGRQQDKL